MTTLAELDRLSIEDAAKLPVADLAALLDTIAAAKEKLKLRDEALTAALITRFGAEARAAREAAGAEFGIVHLVHDGFDVAVDVPKAVKWDQKLCAAGVDRLRKLALDPADYVTVEIKISETDWKKWPDKITRLFQKARIEQPRKPGFTITEAKEAAWKEAERQISAA